MTIQIEAGKYYRSRNEKVVGPTKPFVPESPMNPYRWAIGPTVYMDDGRFYSDQLEHAYDLVEEEVRVEATVKRLRSKLPDGVLLGDGPLLDMALRELNDEVVDEAAKATVEHADIKTIIADEAKRIVSGARRSAYGTPEQNFERIARFWQAYFENTGRGAVTITAADVSPLMRLMKEARLAESPQHFDSFVDLIGYTLTGAEVNKVLKPA